ncbi:MAG: FAD-binding oxidoreductase [Phycisphaeraceae bacterium]|nr:FAD-binding oxidoreductase [Phycisphaeraceae bacterium]
MTVSHWRRSAQPPTTLDVDVCVIGAGICGIAAAIALQKKHQSVVVLERHALASGASSRNAGFLMRGAACHYAEAIDLYGQERAKALWRFTEENLEGLRAEGCEALSSYRRVPSMLLALRAGSGNEPWRPSAIDAAANRAGLERSRDLMRQDGLEVGWLEPGDTGPKDSAWASGQIASALVNPGDASMNSYELMKMLASKLRPHASVAGNMTAPVIENQEVFDIADENGRSFLSELEPKLLTLNRLPPRGGSGRIAVRTADFTIRCERVLVCTNAYASLLLPRFEGIVMPRRGQMLALDAQGRTLGASYYCNDGSEYFRQTADGTIVVGGCRTYFAEEEVGFEDRTTARVQEALESFARTMLGYEKGEVLPITSRWAGTMGFSPDGLPLIGPIAPASPVWFCGGFTGHGMSMGYKAAHEAVDAMLSGREAMFALSRLAAQFKAR